MRAGSTEELQVGSTIAISGFDPGADLAGYRTGSGRFFGVQPSAGAISRAIVSSMAAL
jgi:hypothetical protein